MRPRPTLPLVSVVVLVASAGAARAQYAVPSQVSGSQAAESIQIIEREEGEIATPTQWEVGASLNFLTAKESLGGEALEFTDVALLRIHGLIKLGRRAEIFTGVDILPKQPSYTDELIWQGAALGTRLRLSDGVSTWVRGQTGPELGRAGYWWSGDGAVQYRRPIVEFLYWESELGGSFIRLFPKDGDAPRAHVVEASAKTGLALRDKHGKFGSWLEFSYHLPVLDHPRTVDAQPRIGLQLGFSLGLTRTLDVFTVWSILDRGDLEAPATTLPILNGGFDQSQLVFGFMRRFGMADRRNPTAMAQ